MKLRRALFFHFSRVFIFLVQLSAIELNPAGASAKGPPCRWARSTASAWCCASRAKAAKTARCRWPRRLWSPCVLSGSFITPGPGSFRPVCNPAPHGGKGRSIPIICAWLLTPPASLKTLCADPRWMGGQPALTGVLHTWTRAMLCHSHAHFLVSAGGLSGDGRHWRPAQHPAALPLLALTMLSANLATPVLDSPASDPKPLLCPHCRIGWLVCLGPLRPRRKIPP